MSEMKKKKEPEVALSTFLVVTSEGRLRISVPSTWKVTFGPAVPPSPKQQRYGGNHERSWCLRFYEAENKQRACFTDVTGFYDLSLPIEREVTEKSGERRWVVSSEGSSSSKEEVVVTRKFEND